eukprot:968952-Rhodomonas_salina.1
MRCTTRPSVSILNRSANERKDAKSRTPRNCGWHSPASKLMFPRSEYRQKRRPKHLLIFLAALHCTRRRRSCAGSLPQMFSICGTRNCCSGGSTAGPSAQLSMPCTRVTMGESTMLSCSCVSPSSCSRNCSVPCPAVITEKPASPPTCMSSRILSLAERCFPEQEQS